MVFKYHQELTSLGCNPSGNCTTIEKTSYRWVFADINDPRNFVPVLSIDNSREQKIGCNGWALSLFVTAEQAKARWKVLVNDKKNGHKKFGTHTAVGNIEKTDGVADEVDGDGHYNLHEYTGTDFASKFVILEVLYEEKQ